ncbi:helix-turn-helix transcriptional regulator [Brachybacterium sp. GPGPB12]|uniref:helix-turn-helix domain-containing protein n=1 Tax=Brachybacterium sp. GPGPB12 TaxID=3023517 RepID=UPI0031344F06
MSGGMRPAVVERLGERIRAARQELDLSVGALAEASEVSRRMLTQIELGQANPSVAILDRIAAGLGTTFAALMGVGADDAPDGVEIWSTDSGGWAVLAGRRGHRRAVGRDLEVEAGGGGLLRGRLRHRPARDHAPRHRGRPRDRRRRRAAGDRGRRFRADRLPGPLPLPRPRRAGGRVLLRRPVAAARAGLSIRITGGGGEIRAEA